jgi:uncharacterized protein YjdB
MRLKRVLLAVAVAVSAFLALPAGGAHAASDGFICYQAHIEGRGWRGWECDGDIAGTVGQSRRIEAVAMRQVGLSPFCILGHVEGVGWMNIRCGNDHDVIEVGTTGLSLRLEAVYMYSGNGRRFCANAHVEGIGWQGNTCSVGVLAGTVGESRRLEAIRIWLP